MSTRKFEKPSLTIKQQIDLLKQQGLSVCDDAAAHHILQAIGYYRLSGYLLPFKTKHNGDKPRDFRTDTSLDLIWQFFWNLF